MTRNEKEPLWTVEEVAEFLSLKPGTIRNRVSKGTIPHVKLEGSLRFDPVVIRKWVEKNAVGVGFSREAYGSGG